MRAKHSFPSTLSMVLPKEGALSKQSVIKLCPQTPEYYFLFQMHLEVQRARAGARSPAGSRWQSKGAAHRAIGMQKVFHYNVDQALPRLGFASTQLSRFLCFAEKPAPLAPRRSAGQRGFDIA